VDEGRLRDEGWTRVREIRVEEGLLGCEELELEVEEGGGLGGGEGFEGGVLKTQQRTRTDCEHSTS